MLSDKVQVLMGVRQENPLLALLFNIAIEPLIEDSWHQSVVSL